LSAIRDWDNPYVNRIAFLRIATTGVADPVKGGANYAYVNARTLSFNGDLSIGVTFRYARIRGMQQKRGAMRISRPAASPVERIDGPLRLRTVKGRPDALKNKRATVIWAPVCRLLTQTG